MFACWVFFVGCALCDNKNLLHAKKMCSGCAVPHNVCPASTARSVHRLRLCVLASVCVCVCGPTRCWTIENSHAKVRYAAHKYRVRAMCTHTSEPCAVCVELREVLHATRSPETASHRHMLAHAESTRQHCANQVKRNKLGLERVPRRVCTHTATATPPPCMAWQQQQRQCRVRCCAGFLRHVNTYVRNDNIFRTHLVAFVHTHTTRSHTLTHTHLNTRVRTQKRRAHAHT